jgi:hypothetical protein
MTTRSQEMSELVDENQDAQYEEKGQQRRQRR